jgi:hypothetical protein
LGAFPALRAGNRAIRSNKNAARFYSASIPCAAALSGRQDRHDQTKPGYLSKFDRFWETFKMPKKTHRLETRQKKKGFIKNSKK